MALMHGAVRTAGYTGPDDLRQLLEEVCGLAGVRGAIQIVTDQKIVVGTVVADGEFLTVGIEAMNPALTYIGSAVLAEAFTRERVAI